MPRDWTHFAAVATHVASVTDGEIDSDVLPDSCFSIRNNPPYFSVSSQMLASRVISRIVRRALDCRASIVITQ